MLNRLNGRIAAGTVGAVLVLVASAAGAVPASASAGSRAAVTCPTVDPNTGAVTPKPSNGVNWSGCDLAGANLTKAPLNSANLSGANLTKAVITHAGFTDSDFAGANFTDATGNNAQFIGAYLGGTNFSGATLLGTDFGLAQFKGAKLVHADLAHSTFILATTGKADFTDAILDSASFDAASFAGADLHGASLAHAYLTGAVLNGANLAGVKSGGLLGIPQSLPASFSLSGGYLVGPYANLSGADLTDAIAVNDSFAHVNLTKADLSGADLSSADFEGADAAGAILKGADLTGAELTATNARLSHVAWSTATTCPDGQLARSSAGCFAKPSVAHPPTVTVSVRRGPPGTALTVTSSGFTGTVTVSFGGRKLGKGKAGTALPLTVPGSAQPGLHQVTATGGGKTASAWFTVATDWAQAGYDSGLTSYNPLENTLTPAAARTLAKKFVVTVAGAGPSGAYAVSVSDGLAYIASAKGPLTVVNAATGKTMWTWTEPGTWDSKHINPRFELSQPVVLNGIAYLSVAGEGILTIQPPGKIIWSSQLLDQIDPSEPELVNLSQPTLAHGVLYVTDGENLDAVSAMTGLWLAKTVPTYQGGDCGQPAVASGVLYVRCNNGDLYAYTAPDLTPLWTYAVPGTPQTGRLVVSGGTVYVTTSSARGGGLVAISASTHKRLWTVETAAKVNAPSVAGGVVCAVAQNGLLFARNATTAAPLWSANLGGGVPDTFRPTVADGVVYALSRTGVAYAFNAKTGARLWRYNSGGSLQTAPVVANGIVYFGTKSGGLEAFVAR